ncbi:phosphate acetyltransferase [Actinomycetes bacterium M1A6_2h]
MSDLEYLGTLLGRVDAELQRLSASEPDSDEQASAIDDAADAIFTLREKIKSGYPSKKAYYLAASTDPKGIKVEGITALHGKRVHELVRDRGWLAVDDSAVLAALDDDQMSRYAAVAGRGVASTFAEAREYLAAATGLA